ncbi:hypothetical protein [Novosphingobium sp. BL-52-GroH]|uniref:hypothetical protein n=1 Tax=Novosphingobium sp. BL-52-GroH TaxID=3349877 RepID=UPI003850DCA2
MVNSSAIFDQRPGEFEATRAPGGRVSAIGMRVGGEWRVGLFGDAGAIVHLSVEDAMALSIELSTLAEMVHALATPGEMR